MKCGKKFESTKITEVLRYLDIEDCLINLLMSNFSRQV